MKDEGNNDINELHFQTVLVPIELKQVDTFDESEIENASVGVQTSGGNQSNKDSLWSQKYYSLNIL